VAAVGLFVLGWTTLKFFPALPALVVGGALTLVAVTLAARAGEEARAAGSRYLLRGANHPVVYALVAAVFYFLPLAALGQFTAERLWALVWVDTEAMFPTLVRGDLLLVDRTAYRDGPPQLGDIVVVQHNDGRGPLRLGRAHAAGALSACVAALLLTSVSGAIAALGDTLFPAESLFEAWRQELSVTSNVLIRLRLLHPVIAVAAAGLVVAVARAGARGEERGARLLVGLVAVQLGAGAINVLLLAPIWLQLVHLLLANAVWVAFVLLAADRLSGARDQNPGLSVPISRATSSSVG
jgi:hypothetical protein